MNTSLSREDCAAKKETEYATDKANSASTVDSLLAKVQVLESAVEVQTHQHTILQSAYDALQSKFDELERDAMRNVVECDKVVDEGVEEIETKEPHPNPNP